MKISYRREFSFQSGGSLLRFVFPLYIFVSVAPSRPALPASTYVCFSRVLSPCSIESEMSIARLYIIFAGETSLCQMLLYDTGVIFDTSTVRRRWLIEDIRGSLCVLECS